MKKLMVTAMGAVLLASGGMYAAHGSQVEASGQKAVVSSYSQQKTAEQDVTQLSEYQALSASVDLTGYRFEIIEDNYNKRVALFRDENGQIQYKTIYVKKTDLVKIIKM